MLKKILYIVFCLVGAKLSAQNPVFDSLKTLLNNTREDTSRVILLDRMTQVVADPKVWEPCNTELKKITSQHIQTATGPLKFFYLKFYAIAINNEGYISETQGKVQEALALYDRSLKISRSINEKANIATTINNIGVVYKNLGETSKAIGYYEQALELRLELKDQLGTAAIYNNMAIIFNNQGDIVRALEYCQKALKIREKLGDLQGVASGYNGMGSIYSGQGEKDEAIVYYTKALSLAELNKDFNMATVIMNNLASVFKEKKDTILALRYYRNALKLAKENSNQFNLATSLNNVGSVYKDMHMNDSALSYYNACLEIRRQLNNRQGISATLDNIGNIYLKEGKLKNAENCFTEALALGRETGYPDIIMRAARSLFTLYKQQGKANLALEMHELYTRMKDSITNDNTRKTVLKNQFRYEYQRRATADSLSRVEEKKLSNSRLDKERTQNYVLIAGIIALLVIGFFVFQRFRLKQKVKELKIRNKIASDLHDEVGSALSSISLLSGMTNMENGLHHTTIRKIGETSRETLENMSDIVWSIQPKNDKLTDVVNRMKKYGQQLFASLGVTFDFIEQDEIRQLPLNMEQRKNLYLIYKEALNNAAKYAGADRITVTISNRAKTVVLMISDNGKGFPAESQQEGNGLYTMQERARTLNGFLDVQSAPGKGTVILLQFKPT